MVTGHTHLARAIEFGAKRYYYNCGTWIRLLRLTEEVLATSEPFAKYAYPALQSGCMRALDRAKIPGPNTTKEPLLFDRTNVVRISTQNGRVSGDLLRVTDGAQGAVHLNREPDTTTFQVG